MLNTTPPVHTFEMESRISQLDMRIQALKGEDYAVVSNKEMFENIVKGKGNVNSALCLLAKGGVIVREDDVTSILNSHEMSRAESIMPYAATDDDSRSATLMIKFT